MLVSCHDESFVGKEKQDTLQFRFKIGECPVVVLEEAVEQGLHLTFSSLFELDVFADQDFPESSLSIQTGPHRGVLTICRHTHGCAWSTSLVIGLP